MSSRRLPYATVSRPEKCQSVPLALPHSHSVSLHHSLPPRAPSSTPICWLCALSYLLNSTAQETSHPHFPVSSHPHSTAWLAGGCATQMAPRVPSSWKSEWDRLKPHSAPWGTQSPLRCKFLQIVTNPLFLQHLPPWDLIFLQLFPLSVPWSYPKHRAWVILLCLLLQSHSSSRNLTEDSWITRKCHCALYYGSFSNISCYTFPCLKSSASFHREGNGTHSSTLAWRIPWTEEPGRLQSTGSCTGTWLNNFTFTHWRRKWQPTPVFLPGKNRREGGAWWADIYGVAQSRTRLTWPSSSSSSSQLPS